MRMVMLALAGLLALPTVARPFELQQRKHCRIEVDGKVYLNESCTVTMGDGGNVTVGAGVSEEGYKPSKYFVYIVRGSEAKPDAAEWNSPEAWNSAQQSLGEIRKQDETIPGASCWLNSRANICVGHTPAIFNIYLTVSGDLSNYPALTGSIIGRLGSCKISAAGDSTGMYEYLTPGNVIVISGPFPNKAAATRELATAKACGIQGYTKLTVRSKAE